MEGGDRKGSEMEDGGRGKWKGWRKGQRQGERGRGTETEGEQIEGPKETGGDRGIWE